VARAEADHAADAGLRLRLEEFACANLTARPVGQKRGVVVVEDKGAGKLRVLLAASARVAGA
jgi:hypothetical protein